MGNRKNRDPKLVEKSAMLWHKKKGKTYVVPGDETKRRMVRTREDWYPALEGGYFELSFIPLHSRDKTTGLWQTIGWRVLAKGGDDFGLEKDFKAEDKEKALRLFNRIGDWTTQATLKKRDEMGYA